MNFKRLLKEAKTPFDFIKEKALSGSEINLPSATNFININDKIIAVRNGFPIHYKIEKDGSKFIIYAFTGRAVAVLGPYLEKDLTLLGWK